MPYDKCIKIHNNENAGKSRNSSGIQSVNRYDDNDEKTKFSKVESPSLMTVSPPKSYIILTKPRSSMRAHVP